MKPDLDYLRRVGDGEIVVRVERRPGKGDAWRAPQGLAKLRLHEEAGLVEPMITARWAGIPERMRNEGVAARLTEAGRHLLQAG